LRVSQGLELVRCRLQFQFCREHCFHAFYAIRLSTTCQERKIVERTNVSARERTAAGYSSYG
jgi:hypothetical protein